MAAAVPTAAPWLWRPARSSSSGRSWWCPAGASVPSASAGAMGAAARFERRIIVNDSKTPHHAGFCLFALKRAGQNKRAGKFTPFSRSLPVAETAPAERARMPAGRAIIHRAASAIGTAVPAGSTAAGDADDVGRRSLIERGQRHGPRRGDRRKAEANGKRRSDEYLHSPSFLPI